MAKLRACRWAVIKLQLRTPHLIPVVLWRAWPVNDSEVGGGHAMSMRETIMNQVSLAYWIMTPIIVPTMSCTYLPLTKLSLHARSFTLLHSFYFSIVTYSSYCQWALHTHSLFYSFYKVFSIYAMIEGKNDRTFTCSETYFNQWPVTPMWKKIMPATWF